MKMKIKTRCVYIMSYKIYIYIYIITNNYITIKKQIYEKKSKKKNKKQKIYIK